MNEDDRRRGILQRITDNVADAEGVRLEDLPPLGDEIDVDALTEFLHSGGCGAHAGFWYHGWKVSVNGSNEIIVSKHDDDGPYIGKCDTCGEEVRDVDMETAQDFFARHAERSHAVELFRNDMPGLDQPPGVEGEGTGERAGTD